jgi:hypothetical protein
MKEKKDVDDTVERLLSIAMTEITSTHVIGFRVKGVSLTSYNSRSISSLTTTEDMSANCAAF